MKSAGNGGVVQSRLQVLHVHVFLAVSYTHLDVYKRQVLGKSARDDGYIIMEDNNWFCGDHISGLSVKTMLEY